ncbi:SDR family oxidoreductase [Paraburkholderia humisilvae]|uniref:3-oxoacyl-[acyl-carrier-protein] reductase FabG n=1 Tax=Paraburkholderia humisilvae TaxID=627669 RepID=A0A6J5E6U8_9BURK|nr:SDR family oxidoreductase [Paraburkholderia humisilvae]CAB3762200.1 3-oxoacyl-[acyl-carrier-protein] reductase FabG [Paraburkholderia humisilvae]
MTDTSNRVAIVTGASGGIGGAVAARLARDGFDITVTYSGHSDAADALVSDVKKLGRRAIAIKADVAKTDDVAHLFGSTRETLGRVDVVVNCAGIMPLGPIAAGDVETFDRVIATNLRGSFLIFSAAANALGSGGRIIAFSSSVLGKSFPNYGAYIASKSGVEGLVRVLANELRGRSITVNCIAPGPVGTELFLKGKTEQQIKTFAELAPLERLGTPDDIASAVSFLAGPDGAWINGQILRANGGFA